MIRRLILILLALLVTLAAGLMTAIFIFRHPTPVEFQQATASQPIELPRDEAAHFDSSTEWWYYTGFLNGEDGRSYGFELVFFKAYLPPLVRLANVLPLNWSNNPIYFAQFAVSDQAARKHTFFERTNFPKFWDAGARADRFKVWNGDWRAWGGEGQHSLRGSGGPYRLQLTLASSKPPALHGLEGAGAVDMGQAGTSYYYSEPDLVGTGVLEVDGVPQDVRATAWMDHQWGSWSAHAGYSGWDWLSLRLDSDEQVMLFNFRDESGGVQPESSGTWIAAGGQTEHLTGNDYSVEVLERWTSPDTGGSYPVKWQVKVPAHGLDVTVEATFPEQELSIRFGPIYWEGTTTVTGSASGRGFVEMTGYAGGVE